MLSTTSYDFGDVVLVAFPFTNLQATKKRPAVIISRQIYQQNRPDVILMAITSQIRQPLTTGEAILQDWQTAGLAKPSVLKPLLATLEQTQIVKVMGRLSITDHEALGKVLQTILGE
ncbi:type II toxin-antitoxin system PemK/MazF family toxin [Methylomonas sp. MK1]|uniref:type II toxin-antitoxin system PemK/MazF family toxin n=1 Tax=Methylomonas sp. MK1 TaxID=1131552 RepID=UPI00036A2BB1|nr:type II toxin-antitoxin system PemK/MazF family toxin [Methylomonas sp. MK1]